MAKTLKRVEIFATGRWKGNKEITVTSADLDHMIASFNELSIKVSGYKPFLKLGHQEQQKYFGQKTGAPNLGFIERIWREGEKILADFGNVPDELLALIEQRRYNTVSIEMYPSIEHEGNTFKNVLTAVAILGAELPAVKGLKELAESLFAEDRLVFGEGILTFQQEIDAVFTQEQVDALVAAAVAKAEKIAADAAEVAFAAERTTLTAQITTLTGERDSAQKSLFDFEASVTQAEIAGVVDGAIKEGKIVPKDKADYVAMAQSMLGTAKVKLSTGEVSGLEAFKAMIGKLGKVVVLGEQGANPAEQAADAGMEVDKRARAAMSKDSKLNYADARRVVLTEDADLAQRYSNLGRE